MLRSVHLPSPPANRYEPEHPERDGKTRQRRATQAAELTLTVKIMLKYGKAERFRRLMVMLLLVARKDSTRRVGLLQSTHIAILRFQSTPKELQIVPGDRLWRETVPR